MRYFEATEAPCIERQGSIDLRIEPKLADLGEFAVRRALPDHEEGLAFYVAKGAVEGDGETVQTGVMVVACPRQTVSIRGLEDSRVMVVGGENLGPRQMLWNFVSSRPERIQGASRTGAT